MPRPRFSEMLLQRRRQLGLTCEQASRILKLREDVLVAFEEGNFESMPQSGYAQGMLSSYARYLGLNAREVVDLFQEELYEYVNGSGSHELRRRTRDTIAGRGISGYDVVNEAGSRPKAYVEYHGLLPRGRAGRRHGQLRDGDARPPEAVRAPGWAGPLGRRGLRARESRLPAAAPAAPLQLRPGLRVKAAEKHGSQARLRSAPPAVRPRRPLAARGPAGRRRPRPRPRRASWARGAGPDAEALP